MLLIFWRRNWDGPVKAESALGQVGFHVVFNLMRRAVAGGGVATVAVEVGVEVVSDFQPGFFQAGKGIVAG